MPTAIRMASYVCITTMLAELHVLGSHVRARRVQSWASLEGGEYLVEQVF